MKEKGILFSAPMIRALLDGSKTMTRRVVQPQPEHTGKVNAFTPFEQDAWRWHGGPALIRATYGSTTVHTDFDSMVKAMLKVCHYGVHGDRLFCKETWQIHPEVNIKGPGGVIYRADRGGDLQYPDGKWKPSIFMPRWASRITLELTDVRVERLQSISARDCISEGIPFEEHKCGCERCSMTSELCPATQSSLIEAYAHLWDSIQLQRSKPKGAFAWSQNPWVYAISFKRIYPK